MKNAMFNGWEVSRLIVAIQTLKRSGVLRIIPDEFERTDPYETWEMMEVRLKKFISTSL